MSRRSKRWIIFFASLCLLVAAAVWLFTVWLQKHIEQKIQTAIPGAAVQFASVNIHYLTASVDINEADIHFASMPASIHLKKAMIKGIHAWKWIKDKQLIVDSAMIDGGTVSFHDNLYQYHVAGIQWRSNMDTGEVKIDSVKIKALYNKVEFGRRLGHQADHIVAFISGIKINRISIAALKKRSLFAEALTVQNINVSVFRDRRLPRELDVQPLPVGMVKKIPFNIRLNALHIRNGTVAYEEFPKEGDYSGILKIEHAKFSLEPFITHPLKSDSHMRLKSEGSLMGSGKMFASVYLPLHNDNYHVKGAIEGLDLTRLNSGSENLGGIHIESGLLDSLGFDFGFDEKKSSGKIVGIYHHLVIQPLKNKRDQKKINRFKSFMLRNFIIPLNKDRSLAERKRTGAIDYQRDPTRKISFYLLQSLLTGIKKSFKLGFLLPKK